MVIPPLFGYSRYVLTGASMEPTIHKGSIVYDRSVPVGELRDGDVITYTPPPGTQGVRGHDVTHRIFWVGNDKDGRRAFRTKGDNNSAPDPWTAVLPGPRQARVAFAVPYAGYALAGLSVKWVRMLVIGLPAALIAVGLIVNLWTDAGVEVARQKQAPEHARNPDEATA